jgi:hypothetical protein
MTERAAHEDFQMAYPNKAVAPEMANAMDCSEVQAIGSLRMPCSEHPSNP